MDKPHVLIVDDDESIRFTLSQAIASLSVEIDTAANGEEALEHVGREKVAVVLLDLRMPGMDGMHVLERLHESRPDIPVVIITAHGTIESALDATKLGAVEFLLKPFLPQEVRAVVARVLDHSKQTEGEVADYAACFGSAKRCMAQGHADAAIEHLRKAISISPERPEAYNLLGAIHEIRGEMHEALNNYRVAWNFDPTYEPSRLNIERATTLRGEGQPIVFGELREASATR